MSELTDHDRPDGRPEQPPSILILTKNEECNIAACLKGLSFSDDIVILDSYSTDRTLEIARQFPNVRIYQRVFDTEWKQRNFGLHDIPYKHPWVYNCDADELLTEELVGEILTTINDPSQNHVAYRLRYKNMYMNRWIKRSSGYPVWIIRLVRPKLVRYEVRETNVHPIVDGTVGELAGHFLHYSFNNGLVRWLEKHNYYSTREADEGVKVRAQGGRWRDMFSRDPMLRRRAMKNSSYFLKARALWRFLHAYLLRRGFLDGLAGFHYCAMISMYEYWIELKIREREKPWTEATDRIAAELMKEPES